MRLTSKTKVTTSPCIDFGDLFLIFCFVFVFQLFAVIPIISSQAGIPPFLLDVMWGRVERQEHLLMLGVDLIGSSAVIAGILILLGSFRSVLLVFCFSLVVGLVMLFAGIYRQLFGSWFSLSALYQVFSLPAENFAYFKLFLKTLFKIPVCLTTCLVFLISWRVGIICSRVDFSKKYGGLMVGIFIVLIGGLGFVSSETTVQKYPGLKKEIEE